MVRGLETEATELQVPPVAVRMARTRVQRMKALVTGGSGFIGRRLVERLDGVAETVRVLSRRPSGLGGTAEGIVGEISDRAALREAVAGVDTVFHLAARVHEPASIADEEITFRGTVALVEAAAAAGVERFVFLSSVAVYGRDAPEMCHEGVVPNPTSSYGVAKFRAEAAILEVAERSGMHAIVLRPATVYGAGCKGNIPRMIRAIDRRMFPPPPRQGTPRNFVGVDDVVEAMLHVSNHPAARLQRYNVVDHHPLTVREMYELIVAALGRRVPRWEAPAGIFRIAGRIGDTLAPRIGFRVFFDSERFERFFGGPAPRFIGDKIEKEIGFVPRMDFPTTLPEIIAAYRNQL